METYRSQQNSNPPKLTHGVIACAEASKQMVGALRIITNPTSRICSGSFACRALGNCRLARTIVGMVSASCTTFPHHFSKPLSNFRCLFHASDINVNGRFETQHWKYVAQQNPEAGSLVHIPHVGRHCGIEVCWKHPCERKAR